MNRHDRRRGARHKGAPVAPDPIRAVALARRLLGHVVPRLSSMIG
jgi:hypothetical protein